MTITRQKLMTHFSLSPQRYYHPQSLGRLASLPTEAFRPAAVLIGFIERPTGISVVLTKRSEHLRHHPGQISFPGGKQDPTDASLTDTALRETEEEIGISRELITTFGTLPPLPTISQFNVTPILAFIAPNHQLLINRDEVAEVIEVPVAKLLKPGALKTTTFTLKNTHHRLFGISYKNHFIWGVTGQILHNLALHLSFIDELNT
ncbi:CoA pyrophosphatase [Vibrio astriarenae]|uniref:CoA pyrophosphatase n=1 Tax=Vibrio astriarenae TaxID=1481923 RepID=UPI003736C2C5